MNDFDKTKPTADNAEQLLKQWEDYMNCVEKVVKHKIQKKIAPRLEALKEAGLENIEMYLHDSVEKTADQILEGIFK